MVEVTVIQLVQRDFAMLAYIAKHGFATGTDIRKKFWPGGPTNCNHYARLRQLTATGFVAPLIGDLGVRLGYQITPKGRGLLSARGIEFPETATTRSIYRTSYQHDRILHQVRDILESSPLVSAFVPEPSLRAGSGPYPASGGGSGRKYKAPDGLFTLRTSTRTLKVALELEMTQKSMARYRIALRSLVNMHGVDATFYVCAGPDITRAIESTLRGVRTEPSLRVQPSSHGFYFASLSDLLENGLDVRFRGEGKDFSLSGIAQSVHLSAHQSLHLSPDTPRPEHAGL